MLAGYTQIAMPGQRVAKPPAPGAAPTNGKPGAPGPHHAPGAAPNGKRRRRGRARRNNNKPKP
jgi:hypothetical protein